MEMPSGGFFFAQISYNKLSSRRQQCTAQFRIADFKPLNHAMKRRSISCPMKQCCSSLYSISQVVWSTMKGGALSSNRGQGRKTSPQILEQCWCVIFQAIIAAIEKVVQDRVLKVQREVHSLVNYDTVHTESPAHSSWTLVIFPSHVWSHKSWDEGHRGTRFTVQAFLTGSPHSIANNLTA